MELDLGQLRAFVTVAEHRHFGRAAGELHLTQQALSKRIQKLESVLGAALFIRNNRAVELTDAALRLLPLAHRTLETARAAADAVRRPARPLRIDVWGQIHTPLRLVRRVTAEIPELLVEVSTRRSFTDALAAVSSGQLDAAFGRLGDIEPPAGLAYRPVCITPFAAAVHSGHELATRSELGLEDLAELYFPGLQGSPEIAGWVRRLGADYGITISKDGINLGLEQLVEDLRQSPRRITLMGLDWPIPPDAGVRLIPLVPAPCFLWSLVWRRDRQPNRFLEALDPLGSNDFQPNRQWLPGPDIAQLG